MILYLGYQGRGCEVKKGIGTLGPRYLNIQVANCSLFWFE